MTVIVPPVDLSGYPGLLSGGLSKPTLLMILIGLCGRGWVIMPASMLGGDTGGCGVPPDCTVLSLTGCIKQLLSDYIWFFCGRLFPT